MSYAKELEYKIVPEESFSVIRNCSGCGKKAYFKNTKRFRVNANGNRLDVWLIYQCENCKHTFNLTIYERQKPSSVPKEEYKCFLDNDEQLAEAYGRNLQFFQRNKAEVDFQNVKYRYEKQKEVADKSHDKQQMRLIIHNPYGLKIRLEKQIAEIFGMSRSQVKRLIDQGGIKTDTVSTQCIAISVEKHICEL